MAKVALLKPRAQEEFTSSLGMIVFLASWAMMFCGLFFAYGYTRTRSPIWPPPGLPELPLLLPAVNTVVLVVSSFTFAKALQLLRRGLRAQSLYAVGVTLALGVVFLALQVVVWRSLVAAGLTVRTGGSYGSIFYALTVFHALHVAVGLGILLWVLARTLQGKYTEHNTIGVRLCAMYWHFVDVVWVLMFLTLYVL
ncbi:MAG TPA: cytochrome c oxidase subunit 3 [Byssovorax sp.]